MDEKRSALYQAGGLGQVLASTVSLLVLVTFLVSGCAGSPTAAPAGSPPPSPTTPPVPALEAASRSPASTGSPAPSTPTQAPAPAVISEPTAMPVPALSTTACLVRDLPFQGRKEWALSGFQWSPSGDSIAYVGPSSRADSLTGVLMLAAAPRFSPWVLSAGEVLGDPAWSPDGSQIAFVSVRPEDELGTIQLVSAKGSTPRDLLPGELARTDPGAGFKSVVGWLSSTRLLILTHCGTGCQRPMELDAATGTLTPLFPPGQEGSAYHWNAERSWVVEDAGENLTIGIASGSGGTVRRLSGYRAQDPAWSDSWTSFADWSPDGSQFLFLRQRDDKPAAPELWRWDVTAGSGTKLLSDVVAASWSPQADLIAVLLLGEPQYGEYESLVGTVPTAHGPNPLSLALYQWPGLQLVSLTELGEIDLGDAMPIDAGKKLTPLWAPDGHHLLYYDGHGQPWVLSVAAQSALRLEAGGTVQEAKWSADSRYLVLGTSDRLRIFDARCFPPAENHVMFTLPVGEDGIHYGGHGKQSGPAALAVASDNTFWIADTYGSQLLHYGLQGTLLHRIDLREYGVSYAADVEAIGTEVVVLDIATYTPKVVRLSAGDQLLATYDIPQDLGPNRGLSGLSVGDNGEILLQFGSGAEVAQLVDAQGVLDPKMLSAYTHGGKLYNVPFPRPLGSTGTITAGDTRIDVTVLQTLWDLWLLGFTPDGGLYVVVVETPKGSNVLLAETVRLYSVTGELISTVRFPLEQQGFGISHPYAVGSDGSLYALLAGPDRAEVVRLALSTDIAAPIPLWSGQPVAIYQGPLPCSTLDSFSNCTDEILGLQFEVPARWGAITAKLRAAWQAGYAYDYLFGGRTHAETEPLLAGGRSSDFSEPRGGMPTDFRGFGDPASPLGSGCDPRRSRIYPVCHAVTSDVVWMIRFPNSESVCEGWREYYNLPLFRVEVNLPDNPTINGFVFEAPFVSPQFADRVQNVLFPLLAMDSDGSAHQCDAASQEAYDAEQALLIQSLTAHSADEETLKTLDELTHLAESIGFSPSRPTPARSPTPVPNPHPGWLTYTQSAYGFSFRYPCNWEVVTKWDVTSVIWLRAKERPDLELTVGFRRPDETAIIQRTGVGGGELETQGTAYFLGRELSRDVLVYEGKVKGVLYNMALEIDVDGLIFTLSLDDRTAGYDAGEISPAEQAVGDQVVGTFLLAFRP
jgi:hypothetical protein